MSENERPIVIADPDLEDLIPGFLENRAEDVQRLRAAVGANDWVAARFLGHSMKGAGGGYGFDRISEIGAELEEAAKEEDGAAILRWAAVLEEYLGCVEVRYD